MAGRNHPSFQPQVWQSIKYYALALAVILIGASISTVLQLLQAYLPIGHPLGALAANLSGVTIGTIIMVIGFLKDNRVDQERKRADVAVAQVVELQAKIAAYQVEAAAAQSQVQEERERANRYFAELERFRESYERTTEALIQLLRERDGNHPPKSEST